MRAYKFLNQQYGLKSINERRLRRTRINELNDPFELRPYDLTNPKNRWAFLATRDALAQRFGLLCFSADWFDPLIWAHYSEKHKGMCLGFEIPPEAEKAQTRKVDYIPAPLPFPADFLGLGTEQQLPFVEKMIFTKYKKWEYEHEIRTWTDLEEEFFNFCEVLQPVEVIIGAGSTLQTGEVTRALGSIADRVTVKKARAAHDKFEMVEDERFAQ
ncbi:MAG: DUF2971 domain-containing protein [Candidatus Sulfotelmatobacter sp.]|jgi:hypothetical protein